MIIAQLSDTHVLADREVQFLDNNASLASIVESLNAEIPRPDVVVGTGDLTNWGLPGQYEILGELIARLEMPFLPLVGNHDVRDRMRATFPRTPWVDADHASWTMNFDDVMIIGLDSTAPDVHGAVFDDERMAWLSSELHRSVKPVVLAMHHPPFTTGVQWMDASGFSGLTEFRRVLAEHTSKIIRIICGHFHRPVVTSVEHIVTSVCMAASFHVELDLRPDAERSVIRDPRGYQLHLVDGDTVVSHTRYVDTGEQRFDPGWT